MAEQLDSGWFDALDHVYGWGDDIWPGVTTSLKIAGVCDARWYTDEACRRGTLVHKATEAIDQGKTISPTLAAAVEPYQGYVQAWFAFLAALRPEWAEVEALRWHQGLKVGGRMDRIGKLCGYSRAVVDIKTGGRQVWHDCQVEGYRDLDESLEAAFLVYLWPTGKFRFHEVSNPLARMRFRLAVKKTWETWNVTP